MEGGSEETANYEWLIFSCFFFVLQFLFTEAEDGLFHFHAPY